MIYISPGDANISVSYLVVNQSSTAGVIFMDGVGLIQEQVGRC